MGQSQDITYHKRTIKRNAMYYMKYHNNTVNILHYIKAARESYIITIIDVKASKSHQFIIPTTIQYSIESFSIGSSIYILTKQNQLCIANLFKCTTSPLPNKAIPCSISGMVTVLSNEYLIGGSYQNGSISGCQYYNSITESWIILPCMKEKRCGLAAVCMNNKTIYAIGGYCKPIYYDSMEMMQLRSPTRSWEFITLESKFPKDSMILGHQISNNEMVIFGSHDSGFSYAYYTIKLNGSTIYDVVKHQHSKGIGRYYLYCCSLIWKSTIYFIDEDCIAHGFDMKSRQFSIFQHQLS